MVYFLDSLGSRLFCDRRKARIEIVCQTALVGITRLRDIIPVRNSRIFRIFASCGIYLERLKIEALEIALKAEKFSKII